MYLKVSFFIVCALILSASAQIAESQDFGPKVTPSNIPSARHALGYDKYERQPVDSSRRNSRKNYPYGNNWEQFDTNPQPQFNFGYNG